MKFKMQTIFALAASVLLAAGPAYAVVSLAIGAGRLYKADGTTWANGTAVYLVDADGDGFGDLTTATNSFKADPDDIILGKVPVIDGIINDALPDFELAGQLGVGDKILLVWYPDLPFANDLTGPGQARSFGTFRSDAPPAFSDIGFVIPNDGIWGLYAFTQDLDGDLPNNTFVANQVTQGQAANQPPVASCRNVQVAANGSCQASVTAAQVDNGSSDPDSDPITLTLSPTGPFGLGNTTVTLIVADNKGGTNTCSATITVFDGTAPSIVCPSNISTQAPLGQTSVVVNYPAPTANDNCAGITIISSPASGTSFSLGTTTVTCTATDAAGNTNSCTFTVTVNPASPVPPVALCKNVTVPAVGCSATVTAAQVDNGSNDPDGGPVTLSLSPAGPYPVGSNPVTLTVVDDESQTNTCAAVITVQDVTLPTITCSSNIVVTVERGVTSVPVTFAAPVVSDNCAGVTASCSPASGSSFPLGTTTVTCTAVDASSNTNTCSFTVTVNPPDNQAPVAVCQNVTVPANGSCQASVTAEQVNNGSSDPDGDAITLSLSPVGPYSIGNTLVTLRVVDIFGATGTCTATISVVDETAPTVVCSSNIVVTVGPSASGAVVNFPAPVVSDNCPGATASYSPASGSTFPVGETTVTATAVDAAGHTNTCSFTVTVIQSENQLPVAICRNVTTNAGASCTVNITAAQVNNGSNDPDGGPVSLSLSPAGPYPIGQTTVTLTVVDDEGSTNTCTSTITVVDNTAPNVTCPANITVTIPADQTSAMVEFPTPVGTDSCSEVTVTTSPVSGSAFPVGATTVTVTARDGSGNVKTCTFTVTVRQETTTSCNSIDDLIAQIEQSSLNKGRKQQLISRLITIKMYMKQPRSVLAQTSTFVRLVEIMERQGHLDSETANAWIACIQFLTR